MSDDTFRATLVLAAEGGTPFCGAPSGRAACQDGIPVFATKGAAALTEGLEDRGLSNIKALNAVLAKGAKSSWDFCGGKGATTRA